MFNIIKKFKKFFDKNEVASYNNDIDGALIRKMFPWIQRVDDKKTLNRLLSWTDSDIKKLLLTYYRSEVNQLISEKKYSEIVKYEWILKLVSDIEYLYTNPLTYARDELWSWWQ